MTSLSIEENCFNTESNSKNKKHTIKHLNKKVINS